MATDLDRLAEPRVGRLCVVGIGNRVAGDDGAGSALADRLAGQLAVRSGGPPAGRIIDAGIAPENHLEPIVRDEPDTVLLVDAVDFGGRPGSIRLLDARALSAGGLSTHATSLSLIRGYLSARSSARVVLLGIQPRHLHMGAALSEEVAATVEAVADRLAGLMAPGAPASPVSRGRCPARSSS